MTDEPMRIEQDDPDLGGARRPFRWFRRVLAGFFLFIILLITVPYVIGMFLPKSFRGSASVELAQPPERVMAAAAARPLSAMGLPDKNVERVSGEGEPGTWKVDMGQSIVTERTLESGPGRLVREMTDSVVPISVRWEIVAKPAGSGTHVELTASGTIEDGSWHVPYFRFVMIALGGASAAPRQALEMVKLQLDAAK